MSMQGTPVVVAGYSVYEMEGSGKLSFTEQGRQMTRDYLVEWAQRVAFATAIMGETLVSGGVIQRVNVLRDPEIPALQVTPPLEVQGFGPSSQGGSQGCASYEWARCTVHFADFPRSDKETSSQQPEDPVQFEQELEFGGEFLQAPPGSYRWDSDNVPIAEEIGIFQPSVQFTIRQPAVPELPINAILAALAKQNSGAFLGASANRLLYLGASARRVVTASGAKPWDLVHKMAYRQRNWNEYLRPGVGWAVVEDLSGNPVYGSTSFDTLLAATA